jgi:hypothetical protein
METWVMFKDRPSFVLPSLPNVEFMDVLVNEFIRTPTSFGIFAVPVIALSLFCLYVVHMLLEQYFLAWIERFALLRFISRLGNGGLLRAFALMSMQYQRSKERRAVRLFLASTFTGMCIFYCVSMLVFVSIFFASYSADTSLQITADPNYDLLYASQSGNELVNVYRESSLRLRAISSPSANRILSSSLASTLQLRLSNMQPLHGCDTSLFSVGCIGLQCSPQTGGLSMDGSDCLLTYSMLLPNIDSYTFYVRSVAKYNGTGVSFDTAALNVSVPALVNGEPSVWWMLVSPPSNFTKTGTGAEFDLILNQKYSLMHVETESLTNLAAQYRTDSYVYWNLTQPMRTTTRGNVSFVLSVSNSDYYSYSLQKRVLGLNGFIIFCVITGIVILTVSRNVVDAVALLWYLFYTPLATVISECRRVEESRSLLSKSRKQKQKYAAALLRGGATVRGSDNETYYAATNYPPNPATDEDVRSSHSPSEGVPSEEHYLL